MAGFVAFQPSGAGAVMKIRRGWCKNLPFLLRPMTEGLWFSTSEGFRPFA